MQEYNTINDGDLNPEVQLELEKLNTASSQINDLENKLQELRNVYYETLSKCTSHLTELSNKIGNNVIVRIRPYFNLKRQQIEIQKESQISAARYETACVQMSHANAVVSKNEILAKESSKLDDSTMEILNIAISKVNISKIKKTEAHNEHQFYLNLYMEIEEKIHQIEKKHKNDIKKAKSYFNYSKYMDEKLKDDKLNIDVYEDKVRICKLIYNESLQKLEDISNKIHLDRKKDLSLGPRGEGVGAEIEMIETEKSSIFEKLASCKNKASETSILELVTPKSINYPSNTRKKMTLASSTPIVEGLREAMSSNYSHFLKFDEQSRKSFQDHMKSEIYFDNNDFIIDSEYCINE